MSDASSSGSPSASSRSPSPSTSPDLFQSVPSSTGPSKPLVTEEDKAAAATIKADANHAFQNHNFLLAVKLYTSAAERNPSDGTLFCNP
ncbi:uncharacterized protein EI90DRAFT_1923529 [Cantharellus anzutake]|uniref:uncharacterized protein n=1 Tax=Cantharellus anzutake TaxID=1750568 RepID=UPI001908DEA4|nr:uncharacterized protein EI90DRAFT_1923529 [Cantharellus anzutake]KAF8326705.1 hypothetical protein EI90DRAFT_1923529 [Cantharellus anzutake]